MENGKAFSAQTALAREAASRAESETIKALWVLAAQLWETLRLEHEVVSDLRERALAAGNSQIEQLSRTGRRFE
jgi:hypothetical protein